MDLKGLLLILFEVFPDVLNLCGSQRCRLPRVTSLESQNEELGFLPFSAQFHLSLNLLRLKGVAMKNRSLSLIVAAGAMISFLAMLTPVMAESLFLSDYVSKGGPQLTAGFEG